MGDQNLPLHGMKIEFMDAYAIRLGQLVWAMGNFKLVNTLEPIAANADARPVMIQ